MQEPIGGQVFVPLTEKKPIEDKTFTLLTVASLIAVVLMCGICGEVVVRIVKVIVGM
jgi:hypothetical protein